MKIVVTGGSGFIGSHLVDELMQRGHDVVIIDIASPKFNEKGATFRNVDIMDYSSLLEAMKGCEYVYHLAAEANVDVIHRMPVKASAVNSQGMIHVLEAARELGCRRVIFASTEWVYGAADTDTVDETTKLYPPCPNHLYTSQKIASELFVQNYRHQYDLDYTIMRFGIPFGPRARSETVTCKFLMQALAGKEITLQGGGEQFRQFIYVKDLAQGCVECLREEAKNQIVNLNGKEKISIRCVAETIKKYIDVPFDIRVESEGRLGDFKGRTVDSTKAERLLGWKPQHTYDEAMEQYISWFIKTNRREGV